MPEEATKKICVCFIVLCRDLHIRPPHKLEGINGNFPKQLFTIMEVKKLCCIEDAQNHIASSKPQSAES